MPGPISGIKLIRHNALRINLPDDPSFPFKLEGNFRPPDFMTVTSIALLNGNEEIIVRGMTKEALDEFANRNGLRTHIRLVKLTITGPTGIIEEVHKQ